VVVVHPARGDRAQHGELAAARWKISFSRFAHAREIQRPSGGGLGWGGRQHYAAWTRVRATACTCGVSCRPPTPSPASATAWLAPPSRFGLRTARTRRRSYAARMKTRAAVLHEIGLAAPYAQSRPLSIEEVDSIYPAGEVLVRIRAAGLCHSTSRSSTAIARGRCRCARPRAPRRRGDRAGRYRWHGRSRRGRIRTELRPLRLHNRRPALCEPGFAANSAGVSSRRTTPA